MKLEYTGQGTVSIDGAGEVSQGGTIEVPEAIGAALLEEQPQHFRRAGTPGAAAHEGGD